MGWQINRKVAILEFFCKTEKEKVMVKAKVESKPVAVKVTVNAPKSKKAKPKTGHSGTAYDVKHMGQEPIWDFDRALEFDDETFDHHMRQSMTYYNYFYTQKDTKKHVDAWVNEHMKLSKEDLALFIRSSADMTPMTVCSLVKAVEAGMPLKEKHKAYIVDKVKHAINVSRSEDEPKEATKKSTYTPPTIQDRLNEKTAEIIGEIEGQVDNAYLNKEVINIYEFLTTKNLAQAQVGKVRAHFQKQIDELSVLVAGTDEQVTEAYKHVTNKDIKRIGAFYVKLMADLDSYTQVKKATKAVRIKKAPSKEKLVAKVKYMKEDKILKLVSVPITDVLGASVVWVYQTKYRKLGKYVSETPGSLSIKGTSIIGYSEMQSVQKTLRKPELQLKDFMKAGKVQLRTFLKDIKSTETKLTGRLSEDILVLKVE
jgi:hypothetical protein